MCGARFRLLPVLDAFTRECLAIEVATSIPAVHVLQLLERLFATGAPACLRSDNGPEFIAEAVRTWLAEQHTSTRYIQPGHPWENDITERFNGTLRDECLDQYAFTSLAEARRLVEHFRQEYQEYNEVRPHSELGYRSPTQFRHEWGSSRRAPLPNDPQWPRRWGAGQSKRWYKLELPWLLPIVPRSRRWWNLGYARSSAVCRAADLVQVGTGLVARAYDGASNVRSHVPDPLTPKQQVVHSAHARLLEHYRRRAALRPQLLPLKGMLYSRRKHADPQGRCHGHE
jgi:hypothetical protein